MTRPSGYAVSLTLFAIAGLHIAWGFGSTFPYRTSDELADAVVGSRNVPPAAACGAVAAVLAVAGGLVANVPLGGPRVRRSGRGVVATVLAGRGILGLLGRTELVSPGSSSERFRHLDRRVYGPLCCLLAVGSATAVPRT